MVGTPAQSLKSATPTFAPSIVIEKQSKEFTPPLRQKVPGNDVPPSGFKWWIEKNTPVALSLDAAKELRSMIKVLIERGTNIESGEDYRGILDAAGEAWAKDVYVTKGKSLIQFVSGKENPVDDSLIAEIKAFRVANNPNIYFTDVHFVKHK